MTARDGLRATVYATPEDLVTLHVLGYVPQPVPAEDAKAVAGYITYDQLSAALAEVAAGAPGITRLESIGTSVRGRQLWALRITDYPDSEEAEPEFKYVSTIHGDEPVGTELCLDLIYRLVGDYGSDPRITALVDETDIWIVPLMNPDGYERVTRTNQNGVDLNRHFPRYPQELGSGTYFSGAPLYDEGRQPEVQALMRWSLAHSFVLSANIHTGARVVNYPYDDNGVPSGFNAPTPDDALMRTLALRYATPNPQLRNSTTFAQGITNGAAWYVIDGGMQDWNYRYLGCIEMTLELAEPKAPPASILGQYWAENEESLLAYIESLHTYGIRGLVRDRVSGAPLWAQVNIDGNAQPVFSDAGVGDYYRLLLPGTYRLTAQAPGHITWRSDPVGVHAGAPTLFDIGLSDGDVNADGRADVTDVQLIVAAVLQDLDDPAYDVDGRGTTATDLQAVVNAALAR